MSTKASGTHGGGTWADTVGTVFKWLIGGFCAIVCTAIIGGVVVLILGISGISSLLHPAAKVLKPRFPDVAAVLDEAAHSSALREATLHRNEVRSNFMEWPTYRLRNTKSPIYDPAPTDDDSAVITSFLNTDGDWVPLEAESRSAGVNANPAYWDYRTEVHVDLGSVKTTAGMPGTYVPCAQRSSDGLSFRQGCILREDLIFSGGEVSWARAGLRTAVEDGGNRKVIDRYTAVLEPGQTSQLLTYQMPFKEDAEKLNKEGWYFTWRVRLDTAVILNVNGNPYYGTGSINTSEANDPSGGLALQVTLPLITTAKQVPVEFTAYWYRDETKITVAQATNN